MNNVLQKQESTLTTYQQSVLWALAHGAVLYARPDGSLSYLSRESEPAQHTTLRCLRVVPGRDFLALAGRYVQPASSVVGTAVKVYRLTQVGWEGVGGQPDEA